ncbi:alcohol dehydrogenase [Mycena sanguinolenta]|uniref:Alcohol dehydrogenase n=1 Tax=Mycena sanguinolenta TaxID=230812 RepID=A0A8H6ZE43_9AGAR|nr:alcohol dehydrogenase [Mycena sanguinolenta]
MLSPARLLLNALWLFAAVTATSTYDYVIVGGGATGLSLAVRLSEDPTKTIVVLEAGNSGIGNPNITNLRLNANNFGTANDWQFVTIPQVDVGNRIQAQVQGKVLGGGSAINSGMYLRGNKQEYDALESLGATGWNWDSMFAAVKKSEHFHPPTQAEVDTFNMTWEPAFHGFDGPISIAIQAVNVSHFFPDFAVPTLKNLGHEMNIDPNGGFHNGPYLGFSDYTTGLKHPLICCVRILSPGHQSHESPLTASGVEYISFNETGIPETRTINAKNVILSGSTLNTPKVLELSGIGDPAILNGLDIDVVVDLPGVGANLCNQPITTASYLIKNGTVNAGNAIRSAIIDFQPFSGYLSGEDLERSNQLLETKPDLLSEAQFNIMKAQINAGVPQMEFAWNIAADANNVSTLTFDRLILVKPLSRGTVHINSTDPLVPPVIDPKYLSAPHDKFAFAKGVQFTRTIVDTEPLKSIIVGPVVPDATVQTDEDFVNYVNTISVSEHHFVGTSAMTPRSEGGVVDPSLVVYGTSNVRVADLSVIASLPGIHTVSLAYMVAERAAEIIKEQDT